MHFPYNSRLSSIILVALLALAPCWAAPAKGSQNTTPPNTSPQHTGTHNTPPPQTPANPVTAGGQMELPSRPGKARLDRTTVTRFLAEWTHEAGKADQLRGIAASTGGTEAWVQYEFEYFMKKMLKIPVEQKIRMREQRPYLQGDQRADWIIKPDISLSVGDTKGLVIELKVESEAEKETPSARAKRVARLVQEDINKVSAGFKAEFTNYASAVIAIASIVKHTKP